MLLSCPTMAMEWMRKGLPSRPCCMTEQLQVVVGMAGTGLVANKPKSHWQIWKDLWKSSLQLEHELHKLRLISRKFCKQECIVHSLMELKRSLAPFGINTQSIHRVLEQCHICAFPVPNDPNWGNCSWTKQSWGFGLTLQPPTAMHSPTVSKCAFKLETFNIKFIPLTGCVPYCVMHHFHFLLMSNSNMSPLKWTIIKTQQRANMLCTLFHPMEDECV